MSATGSNRQAPRAMLGVLVVSVAVGALELGRHALQLAIPNPPAVLLVLVVFAAYHGGIRPGLVAAGIAWAYFAYFFSDAGTLLRYSGDNFGRVMIWGVTTPTMAILVGVLYQRAVRAGAVEEGRRAAAAIHRGEVNTRLIVDTASDAIVAMDAAGTITGWNPQAERMFGWKSGEALGRSFVATVIAPAHRGELEGRLARSLKTSDAAGLRERLEIGALHRDGREFPVEISVCALLAGDGHVFSAFIRDITDRKAAERSQALLVRELDHRVKNNLATVLAVMDQTASRSASIPEFMETFRGRVMAMARLHRSLAASRWSGADLHALVRQTLEPYTLKSEGRVIVRGCPVTLPASAVPSLCMALHELATNAAKYGALSVPEGRVSIEWDRRTGPDGNDRLRLLWSEGGGPVVEAPTRYGFGRQLIEEGVPYESGGHTNLAFSPSGVTCELIVPLPPETKGAPG